MLLLRSVLILLGLSVASMVWANHDDSEPSDGTVMSFIEVTPPESLGAVSLLRGETQEIELSDFRGKLILLNLWATWCPPCLRELPALDRLQQRLGSEHFEVVAVALDRRGYAGAREFFDKLNIKHLTLYHGSTDAFAAEFPVDLFPASFLIDSQGRVLSFLRSYADWDAPEAHAMIQRHLQTP
ncbi:MAG: thiol-disulfide isomerase/thioredoxin [Motiliproteus sp.]|jgi:thiol-disulfide isomerase/thioredoxin